MSTVQKEEWEYYLPRERRCHQCEPCLNIQLPRRACWASFDVYSRDLKSEAEDLGKGCLQVDNNATILSKSDVREPARTWWYTRKKTRQIIERVWIGCSQEVMLKDLQERGDASGFSSDFSSKATFHVQQSVVSPPPKKSLTKRRRWINECLWQSSHSQIKGDGDN